jgi:hypothetical protein
MAEDIGRGISDVSVDQLSRYDAMAIEGLPVCQVGPGQPRIAGRVVPSQYRQCHCRAPSCALFCGLTYHPPCESFSLANFSISAGSDGIRQKQGGRRAE